MRPAFRFSISIALTALLAFGIPFTWAEMPEFQLWQRFSQEVPEVLRGSLFQVLHLVLAFPLFTYGAYHCIQIAIDNDQAHAGKNNPTTLLTTGYYGRVRHPMYGMFFFMITALFFSLCSLLAAILQVIFLAVFGLAGILEEKYMLLARFGDAYRDYRREIPNRYLTVPEKVVLACYGAFLVLGILFM